MDDTSHSLDNDIESLDAQLSAKLIPKVSNQRFQWSNQTVLTVTCASFAIFVIAEMIAAVSSGSLSLLGDAAAMTVDVFTYFANMYAEYVKSKNGGELNHRAKIALEIGIPVFSIAALLGVTGYITSDSLNVILHPDSSGDDLNVYILYAFSSLNALVDIVSVSMFYMKGKAVFYHPHNVGFLGDLEDNILESKEEKVEAVAPSKNLNMISAFTHVGSDSMRTLAVFSAAVISTAANIDPDVCDAWAAVVVSITIVIAVIPLIIELKKSISELF